MKPSALRFASACVSERRIREHAIWQLRALLEETIVGR
jgi:hypothetical protein